MNPRRITTSIGLAGASALLVASSALAGGCPPHRIIRDPAATICLAGDPRAYPVLDNTGSNVSQPFRIIYNTGKANRRHVIDRTLGAGDLASMKLWAHGQTWVRVRDGLTGELLARIYVTRSNISSSCPRPDRQPA